MGLTGNTTLGQDGAGSIGNKRVLHTLQVSRTGTSPLDAVTCHAQDTPFEGEGTCPSAGDSVYLYPTG